MIWLVFLALPFLGFIGAFTSQKIKVTNKLIFVPPLVSFGVGWFWILLAKYTTMSLAVAQIMFDTIYILSYFLSFVYLGETITLLQAIGTTLAVIGIILLSL